MSKRIQSGEEFVRGFYGEDRSCEMSENLSETEWQQSINDCYSMLQYSLDRQDKDEVAFWRRMLQRAKVEKRSMASSTA